MSGRILFKVVDTLNIGRNWYLSLSNLFWQSSKTSAKVSCLLCYHIGISPFGGLVYSFSQLYFTINLEEIFYFNKKNAVFMRLLAFRKRLGKINHKRRRYL